MQYHCILLIPLLPFCGRISARRYVDRWGNQVHHIIQMLFLNNDVIFQDDMPSFTRLELFSHGLKSMKVSFIFPGQHNRQISILLNNSGLFWWLEWGRDPHLQHPRSNLKMFFEKNGVKFHYRLFETCMSPFQEGLQLYWRRQVVEHHINKEMCTVFVVFPLFCPTPADTYILHSNSCVRQHNRMMWQ
jgi:hypothetical protein